MQKLAVNSIHSSYYYSCNRLHSNYLFIISNLIYLPARLEISENIDEYPSFNLQDKYNKKFPLVINKSAKNEQDITIFD